MKRNNPLSEEELQMLLELSEPTNETNSTISYQINFSDERLVTLFGRADNLFIEATFNQYNLRVPISLLHQDTDMLISCVGTPEIFEHALSAPRSWRLDSPENLVLRHLDGTLLPFEIINISTSGLLIQDHQTMLKLGEHFDAVLSGMDVAIPLIGVVIRKKKGKNKNQEWAIHLTLDANTHATLQEYIYQQHQKKYP
ncbi:PilZ domain-containing protein [Tolumonas lignilytica]|uniref:PilZ domain-containing protein n=1 Tax=Tolumonas lignilytica TaxID=1283284 RepID=UPI00046569DB|nr:PilZ domain-containing protein [Tolumonas lignilytica]